MTRSEYVCTADQKTISCLYGHDACKHILPYLPVLRLSKAQDKKTLHMVPPLDERH